MLTRRNELRSRPAAMPVAALLNMLLHLAFRLASTSILKALPICVASGLNALICVDPFWRLEPAEVVSVAKLWKGLHWARSRSLRSIKSLAAAAVVVARSFQVRGCASQIALIFPAIWFLETPLSGPGVHSGHIR
ncbi:uncharacterized protein CIMG_01853 [Coccidioides immitis RS]|uniref:Uncharacterized protein n=1 Tax=Coccidioides immitis (strain RS) TaxID=246410 RepID=J3KK33_COCIM|nr:uncharacterized protein CIMG_01853 [Coccidioides immitis RS]EAS36499.3 hypothetical protein CIMG_01853 [Coccidioides immitis RS]